MSGSLSQSQLEAIAAQDATENGIPVNVFEQQINIESGFNPNAFNSSSGATGIAQFLPSTAADAGFGIAAFNPNDPVASLSAAAQFDAALSQQTGSLGGGLAAFNEGLGTFQQQGIAGASPAYQQLIASLDGSGSPADTFTSNGLGTGAGGFAGNASTGSSSAPSTGTGSGAASSSPTAAATAETAITHWGSSALFIGVGLLVAVAGLFALVLSNKHVQEYAKTAALAA